MVSVSVARTESFTVFIPEFERLIAEVMEEWKVPGLAVAVVQNGEVAFVGPYSLRDVEVRLRVTTDTQFQLMSVSKSFTATVLSPFGGPAADGLEEAGAGIHPGISAA
jgi:CubicO group peptidase (beta-lactamase class C family)